MRASYPTGELPILRNHFRLTMTSWFLVETGLAGRGKPQQYNKKDVLDMKKIISLIVAIALVFSLMAPVSAAESSYYPAYTGRSNSLVDGLNAIGVDSSYKYREKIAEANSIPSGEYRGSAQQNTYLLSLLRSGQLQVPGAQGAADVNQKKNDSGAAMQPVGNVGSQNDTYIEVTSSSAPLRSGPGKSYDEIATLQAGDCLIYIECILNQYQNQWIKVKYGDSVAYLYKPHAVIHQHCYSTVADGLNTCKCGSYIIDEGSVMMQTSLGIATAGTLLTTEAVIAAGQLSSTGVAISVGLATAFPYVAVVAVGGMLIYMAVNSTGTQVRDVIKIKSIEDVKKLVDKSSDAKVYYAAAFSFGEEPMLLLAKKGMDLNKATNYLSKCVRNPLDSLVYATTGKSMVNIYTFTDDLAEALCKNFVAKEKSYAYGDSDKKLCMHEHDNTYKTWKIYFEHYHIFYVGSPFSLIKNRDIHILFGNPLAKNELT